MAESDMSPGMILERIRAESDATSSVFGDLTNSLLKQFQRGYPLENLRPLLQSDNSNLISAGIWIASELGREGEPLLGDVLPLLKNPLKRVRFFAIDCISLWATPSNKRALASAVGLMNDNEAAVRWKVMEFLSLASPGQLKAALAYLEDMVPESPHISGLQWLLSPGASNPNGVESTLQSMDSLTRKYGVVGAARMSKVSQEPLRYASSVDDPDVKNFADSSIRLLGSA
jgi:hypothetical protein